MVQARKVVGNDDLASACPSCAANLRAARPEGRPRHRLRASPRTTPSPTRPTPRRSRRPRRSRQPRSTSRPYPPLRPRPRRLVTASPRRFPLTTRTSRCVLEHPLPPAAIHDTAYRAMEPRSAITSFSRRRRARANDGRRALTRCARFSWRANAELTCRTGPTSRGGHRRATRFVAEVPRQTQGRLRGQRAGEGAATGFAFFTVPKDAQNVLQLKNKKQRTKQIELVRRVAHPANRP